MSYFYRVCIVLVCGILAVVCFFVFFFFKQKTAYEMRISDWSSDVCSSDLAFQQTPISANPGITYRIPRISSSRFARALLAKRAPCTWAGSSELIGVLRIRLTPPVLTTKLTRRSMLHTAFCERALKHSWRCRSLI